MEPRRLVLCLKRRSRALNAEAPSPTRRRGLRPFDGRGLGATPSESEEPNRCNPRSVADASADPSLGPSVSTLGV
jgi:hypothetical protein